MRRTNEAAARHVSQALQRDSLRRSHRSMKSAVEASEVLGVARSATAAEVRKAHRDLARQNHPDKVGGSPEAQAAAEEKMQKLNWAKEVLLSLKDSD